MSSPTSQVPIVSKVMERTDPEEHGASLKPVQKREVVLRLEAESLDNMRKQATVRVDQPKGSTFQIICDEGPYLGGDDSAPPPLAYYSASIAFCLLTQLSRYASIKKLNIHSMKLSQETRFAMEGSVVKGTLAGRGVEVVTNLDIESDESEETIRQMIEVGKNSCFIHQSIMNPVPSRIEATVNGDPLLSID
ncbi:OsmC family protein [Aporhodopirellula aestuarii]|uniref:OsmC family protein n=1 Tax=Aporhodopirellula aestuarii TaxID=2950107 RepID=A0ABT0UFD6_9BACT|nr:OsmC family protein [Aporhodopirellula aestuarii]MCM2375294.1 OsmC family protein [Aporhodopirellula aestuarii]